MFLGPIETDVRKCIFRKYVSRKITWSPILSWKKSADTSLCFFFRPAVLFYDLFFANELIIL